MVKKYKIDSKNWTDEERHRFVSFFQMLIKMDKEQKSNPNVEKQAGKHIVINKFGDKIIL